MMAFLTAGRGTQAAQHAARGRQVFGISKEHAEIMAPALSNQGGNNGFLATALARGFLLPDPATAQAFTVWGMACMAVAGVWGALTVTVRIFSVQTVCRRRWDWRLTQVKERFGFGLAAGDW